LHDTSSPGIELKHGCTTYNIGEIGRTGSVGDGNYHCKQQNKQGVTVYRRGGG